jgi:sulfur carrier protein ThiS
MAVFLNDHQVKAGSLETTVNPDDQIEIFAAVAGG